MDLSKLFGVEEDRLFSIKNKRGVFKVVGNDLFQKKYPSDIYSPVDSRDILDILVNDVPDNLNRFIDISADQLHELRCIHGLRGRYLVKVYTGFVWAYTHKPILGYDGMWDHDGNYPESDCFQILPDLSVYDIVGKDSKEPFNIEEALTL